MIASLMTTLIMALGVATGNVSSNSYKGGNVFNNEEKIEAIELEQPQPKKTTFIPVDLTIEDTTEVQTLENQSIKKGFKAYLGENNNNQFYYTNALTIRNTIYSYNIQAATQSLSLYYLIAELRTTMELSEININLMTTARQLIDNDGTIKVKTETYLADETVSELINMNLTNSINNDIQSVLTTAEKTNIQYTTERTFNVNQDSTFMEEEYSEYSIDYLTRGEVKYLVIQTTWKYEPNSGNNRQLLTLDLTELNITARGVQEPINYEIIDVPNLMFTILTLPYTWFSTAFNLTIFPNTPYSLNFGNLVLTILAAMILMYLIKKVIR